jgi:hypothetical protein
MSAYAQQPVKFESFSNFKIANGSVFWQNVYEYPGLSKDSIENLILSSTKADDGFTLTYNNDSELTFDLADKSIQENGRKYQGKITSTQS